VHVIENSAGVLNITGTRELQGVCASAEVQWAQWSGTCGKPPNDRPGTWVQLSIEMNGDRRLGAKTFVPDLMRDGDVPRSLAEARAQVRAAVGGRLLEALAI
jgi:hypothetical protein